MPYSTEFIDDGTGVYREGTGVVTGAELIAGAVAIHSAPDTARRLTHGLVDLTAVTEFRVTPADLRRLAEENLIVARLVPRAFVAIVAPTDYIFGSVRMWQVFAADTGWNSAVFRDRHDAEKWLQEHMAR